MKAPEVAPKVQIGIFLSGKGSNARAILEAFKYQTEICVAALYTNNEHSGARSLAEQYHIPYLIFDRSDFSNPAGILARHLEQNRADAIVLAGFLWLLPPWLVQQYAGRIINIHPALLPKYGGKGMYGRRVHEAVWQNKEKETGITIHIVDEHYDEGDIIAQYKCPVSVSDSPEDIEAKVRALELRYYPEVISRYFCHTPFPPQVGAFS